jgi:hypothetical protein
VKRIALLALALAGCDNSALLANVDTYTCAYLPSVIDCTTQDVHDKAVSLLENGLVEAQADCAFAYPSRRYRLQVRKLHDGSAYIRGSAIDGGTPSHQQRDSNFCGRSESCSDPIYLEAHEIKLNNGGTSADETIKFHLDGGVFSAETCFGVNQGPQTCNVDFTTSIASACTGFNLGAF